MIETNPLDASSVEYKYYASGFGLILIEEGLDANFANPKLSGALISGTPVPVPAALPLPASALAGFGALARRRSATVANS